MSEYFDVQAGEDLDPFAREVDPLTALEQDLGHMITDPSGSHIMDPEWGIGLEDYLGKPLPSNLSAIIEEAFERDSRVLSARVVVVPLGLSGEDFEVRSEVQATEGFLAVARTISRNVNAVPPAPVIPSAGLP